MRERHQADALIGLRIKARQKRRLTYDCMNGIVKGDIVVCKKGHTFKTRGRSVKLGIGILAIIRGTSSSACQKCGDYNEETDE